ncbi:TRAP transporter large permease [Aquibaculum sediminis]|uniref:TRAP transporter large permease n=1 Tax=Aquibaculum sediminis TaxID=3231907 RepID=UPI003454489E
MSTEYLGLVMLGLLLVTIFMGFPIAFTLMLLAVVFGYMGLEHRVFRLMVSQTFGLMQEEVLAAVPLFVLMGFFLERSGLMERLFRALQLAMGGMPGSLFLVTLLTATVFATATGIIGASVTVIGLLAVPVMLKNGYYPRLAAGVVCAGGTLGILIPPSIMLVLMGPVLGVSVLHLFAGAIIPGLLLASMHMGYAMFRAYMNPALGPPLPVEERAANWGVVVKELIAGFLPAAALMFFALGTILMGIATPTEAAGLGAFGAFLLAILYRRMNWPMFKDCMMNTLQTTSMILFLAVAANIYASIFSRLGSGALVTNWFLNMPFEPFWIMVMMMILIFLLAWPLEWPAIVLIFVPILAPIVRELELSLLWFGILVAVNLQSAFLSPPVAMAAYYLKGAAPELSLGDIYIGMLQFNVIQNIAVVLVLVFPGLALWLPGLIYG